MPPSLPNRQQCLQSVLDGVCSRFGYLYGEALVPSDDGIRLCRLPSCETAHGQGSVDFARSSSNFCFPPNVCLPGRVWHTRTAEWHEDTSVLAPPIFLRVAISQLVGLKGGVCFPLISKDESRGVIAVLCFLSSSITPTKIGCAQEVMDFANSLLDATQRDSMSFRSDACHPSPSAATSAGAAGGGGGWGGYVGEAEEGKCWADAKQMLLIPPSGRDKEAMGNILKFSKRLPLFKYITNTQRTALCSSMEHIVLDKGQETHRISDPEDDKWQVVVTGSVTLMARMSDRGEYVRMCSFGPGETFGHSYLKLFCTTNDMDGYIVCDMDGTECVRVTIPDLFRNDFRTLTRPVWYCEMSRCFHYSVDQAADKLGICMSVIKKICRRHGISRWPHRKLQSANKILAVLDAKIASCTDPVAREALVSEASNLLTRKLRLTANPSFVVGVDGGEEGSEGGKAKSGGKNASPIASDDDINMEEDEDEGKKGQGKRRKTSPSTPPVSSPVRPTACGKPEMPSKAMGGVNAKSPKRKTAAMTATTIKLPVAAATTAVRSGKVASSAERKTNKKPLVKQAVEASSRKRARVASSSKRVAAAPSVLAMQLGSNEAGPAGGMHGQAQYYGLHEQSHHGGYVGHHPWIAPRYDDEEYGAEYWEEQEDAVFSDRSSYSHSMDSLQSLSMDSECTDDSGQCASDVSSTIHDEALAWESSSPKVAPICGANEASLAAAGQDDPIPHLFMSPPQHYADISMASPHMMPMSCRLTCAASGSDGSTMWPCTLSSPAALACGNTYSFLSRNILSNPVDGSLDLF